MSYRILIQVFFTIYECSCSFPVSFPQILHLRFERSAVWASVYLQKRCWAVWSWAACSQAHCFMVLLPQLKYLLRVSLSACTGRLDASWLPYGCCVCTRRPSCAFTVTHAFPWKRSILLGTWSTYFHSAWFLWAVQEGLRGYWVSAHTVAATRMFCTVPIMLLCWES